MTVSFEVESHSVLPDKQAISVRIDGEMVAMIYPGDHNDIRIVSAHIGEITNDNGTNSIPPIPHVGVSFEVTPFTVWGSHLIRLPKGWQDPLNHSPQHQAMIDEFLAEEVPLKAGMILDEIEAVELERVVLLERTGLSTMTYAQAKSFIDQVRELRS